MRRNFIRYVSVGTVVVALAAAIGASAFAASSNRGHQFGPRGGLTIHGFGPGFGFGFGLGFPGGPGVGGKLGGGGVTYADVLTPAADYLNVSLSTLQSDLKGGKTLAQEATAKGKTASGLVDAIVAAEKKVLDAQTAAGWLTDAQATALLDNFKSQVTDLVNNGPGVPRVGLEINGPLQTAADYLGISVSDLIADLKAGKTLAQEATAKGKTVDGLVQAMLAPLKTKLDKSVASGDITAAQETTILNRATTALTNLVNNTKPEKLQAGLRQAGLRLALPRLFIFR
jgi:D-Tyr-tRNAtyr deacylase